VKRFPEQHNHNMKKPKRRPRVLLADDFPAVLEQVQVLLGEDFDVVASAPDGQKALRLAMSLDPDILVLDICMPILSGIQVVSKLRDSGFRGKCVILTALQDKDYQDAAFANGALGFVLKSRVNSDLIPAIRAALEGHRFAFALAPLDCFA
jgi:DNA-binding NarL/FixJ family response regulator